jgi:hypothetical protein
LSFSSFARRHRGHWGSSKTIEHRTQGEASSSLFVEQILDSLLLFLFVYFQPGGEENFFSRESLSTRYSRGFPNVQRQSIIGQARGERERKAKEGKSRRKLF